MFCTECGKENPEQRTYCSACGSTMRDGGSHFTQELYRLVGSIDTAAASLELTITDKTFVAGQLSVDGLSKVENRRVPRWRWNVDAGASQHSYRRDIG